MTLTDINKALSNLAEQPTRENILAFSFELLQWMNITPNADNKPQLLSPQTLKLKDYLGNAPQTVQPQLYRLSADNQTIRVRFAVLKKLKREYISQLVDNDPGLGSYQAMAKGLTTPTTGTAFIPAQPYFVHFVTTPDYDKLVLIFNQGEQKRIVSFRNRLTNTQYHKIIQAWQGIGTKAKPEIADLLWKSLDIKEVNKEFYKQIKERFDALIGIVKTQHSTATENQVKQFTVRMIGRYIFCWFLKEKGIIPLSLISKQTIESTDKYYQTVLLKLFFETLNTKVQDRDPLKHNKLFEKIPYLNGGLFDESEEDKLFTKLDLDAWLLPFVEILESYDFTVDESSSQYQQVAVDPEMLGRIFENLLASQNEETEKLANQRKAFGAFYTPREIVDYMVNESIKAFLQTQWEQHLEADKTKHINNPVPIGDIFGNKKPQQLAIETKRYQLKPEEKQKIEKALEPLFASNPDAGHLKKEEKTLLLGFLEQIKILDPACGSGAFPMGILHKLVELHEALGTVKSSYELKKDILSQNIYGVDIMPMAIEIARLRAWLSLVLEEDYKPTDPKHNFGVKPLPNLDFKFVCANSLIDLGLDAFIADTSKPLLLGFNQKLIGRLKELEDLRKSFFTPVLASTEKEKLKADYLLQRNEVVSEIEEQSEPILKAIGKKIKHWNPFDDSQPSAFFSPTWMFGIDKGFDVVIGNPPYIQLQKNGGLLADLYESKNFQTFKRTGDIYTLFYENGVRVLKQNGHLCFITSNKFMRASYGQALRNFLSTNTTIKEIVDFGELPVFAEAATFPAIVFLKKQKGSIQTKLSQIKDLGFQNLSSIIDQISTQISIGTLKEKAWSLSDDKISSVLEKMRLKSTLLGTYLNNNIKYGVKTGFNEAFVIDQAKKDELVSFNSKCVDFIKPLINGDDIRKYEFKRNNRYVIVFPSGWTNTNRGSKNAEQYIKEMFMPIYQHLKNIGDSFNGKSKGLYKRQDKGDYWWELRPCKYYDVFAKPKIHVPAFALEPRFAYDTEGFYSFAPAYIIPGDKYLLSILNSSAGWFALKKITPILGDEDERGRLIIRTIYFSQLPIPTASAKEKDKLVKIVDKIHTLKKLNKETASLEKEIDVLVYHLYELTYDEVKIIDKEFWLSEEEYNNYKMQ